MRGGRNLPSSLTCLQSAFLAKIQSEHVSKGCLRWQYRTCRTGISQCDYLVVVQTRASIDWRRVTCLSMSVSESVPVTERTLVDFTESMSTFYDPPFLPLASEIYFSKTYSSVLLFSRYRS